MGYRVNQIKLYSIKDNKNYNIKLPKDDIETDKKFKKIIYEIRNFKMENFKQTNREKCQKCIYEPSCDRSLLC